MENRPVKGERLNAAQAAYQQYQKKDTTTIALAWDNFEKELLKYSEVKDYIDAFIKHHCKEKNVDPGKLATLKLKFFTCLNEDEILSAILYSIPRLHQAHQKYHQQCSQNFKWDEIVNDPLIINEYADFIERPGQWILPLELHILAIIFNLRVKYYTKNPIHRTDNPVKLETYNQRNEKTVAICFNGTVHYEQMANNDELLLEQSNLKLKTSNDKPEKFTENQGVNEKIFDQIATEPSATLGSSRSKFEHEPRQKIENQNIQQAESTQNTENPSQDKMVGFEEDANKLFSEMRRLHFEQTLTELQSLTQSITEKPYVYLLGYAPEQKHKAEEEIVKRLKQDLKRLWGKENLISPSFGLKSGDSILRSVSKMKDCKIIIVLCTPALKQAWEQFENGHLANQELGMVFTQLVEQKAHVIPFYLKDRESVLFFLKDLKSASLSTEKAYQEGIFTILKKLIEEPSIKNAISQTQKELKKLYKDSKQLPTHLQQELFNTLKQKQTAEQAAKMQAVYEQAIYALIKQASQYENVQQTVSRKLPATGIPHKATSALSRKGLSDKGKISPQQLIQTLPQDKTWDFGMAIDNGDCFYDAIVQSLHAKATNSTHSIKSLRKLCSDYIYQLNEQSPQANWIKEAIEKGKEIDSYETHLTSVQFTAEEMISLKQENMFTGYVIWGKSHIEGKILAQQLKISIHIIEFHEAESVWKLCYLHISL